jgi:hypothetical protein
VGDVDLGRRGDVADVVKGGQVGPAQLRQAVDDMGAQVRRRGEEVYDALGLELVLERLEFGRARAGLDVGRPEDDRRA